MIKRLIVASIFLVILSPAWALEHTYHATWNQNDPDEGVNRYELEAVVDQGATYTERTIGSPPLPEVTIPIEAEPGSLISFTVKACRDITVGDPQTEEACSDPSNPITMVHSYAPPSIPNGLNVIRITVEVSQ